MPTKVESANVQRARPALIRVRDRVRFYEYASYAEFMAREARKFGLTDAERDGLIKELYQPYQRRK